MSCLGPDRMGLHSYTVTTVMLLDLSCLYLPPAHRATTGLKRQFFPVLAWLTNEFNQSYLVSWGWWRTPSIPALRKQKQVDLCEFEASLVYKS